MNFIILNPDNEILFSIDDCYFLLSRLECFLFVPMNTLYLSGQRTP